MVRTDAGIVTKRDAWLERSRDTGLETPHDQGQPQSACVWPPLPLRERVGVRGRQSSDQ